MLSLTYTVQVKILPHLHLQGSCRDCNGIDSFVTTREGDEVCVECGLVDSAAMVITQEEMQQRGLPRRITLPSIQNSSILQFLETHYQGYAFFLFFSFFL